MRPNPGRSPAIRLCVDLWAFYLALLWIISQHGVRGLLLFSQDGLCNNFFSKMCHLESSDTFASAKQRKVDRLRELYIMLETSKQEPYLEKAMFFYNQCKRYQYHRSDRLGQMVYDFQKIDNISLVTNGTADLTPMLMQLWDLRAMQPFFDLATGISARNMTIIQVKPAKNLLGFQRDRRVYKKEARKTRNGLSRYYEYNITEEHLAAAFALDKRLTSLLYTSTRDHFTATLWETQDITPFINFTKLLSQDAERNFKMKLLSNPILRFQFSTGYLTSLHTMLETYPEEIWKAWFKMLIILEVDEHHSMYMSETVIEEYKRLGHYCHYKTFDLFPQVFSRFYFDSYLDQNVVSNVTQISSSIKEEFIQQLGDSKWLNDEFSKDAQNKFRSMTLSIDDPDLYLIKEAIEHYYKELHWGTNHLPEMVIDLKKFTRRERLSHLGDGGQLWMTVPHQIEDVDIYYSADLNRLMLPPFYFHQVHIHHNTPDYYLYGKFGTKIAYEMANSLNLFSPLFAFNDDDKPVLTPEEQKQFMKKISCFVQQSLGIRKNDNSEDGYSAQELFADTLGFQIAHDAYMQHLYQNGTSRDQYRKNLQMFYYAYAQLKCPSLSNDVVPPRHAHTDHSICSIRLPRPRSRFKVMSQSPDNILSLSPTPSVDGLPPDQDVDSTGMEVVISRSGKKFLVKKVFEQEDKVITIRRLHLPPILHQQV